jgi:ech hydrogenase subunit D
MEDYGRNIITIELDQLLSTATEKKMTGWRLAQICSAYVDGRYELSYTFGKEYEVVHYRIVVHKETLVPSITQIYDAAFLYENEMKELFGVNMEHIAVDYKNKLYRIDEEAPFIQGTAQGKTGTTSGNVNKVNTVADNQKKEV